MSIFEFLLGQFVESFYKYCCRATIFPFGLNLDLQILPTILKLKGSMNFLWATITFSVPETHQIGHCGLNSFSLDFCMLCLVVGSIFCFYGCQLLLIKKLGSPDAIPGLTPFMLHRILAAAWTSFVLLSFLNAFLVSVITTRGVFIWTRFTKFGRNFPR